MEQTTNLKKSPILITLTADQILNQLFDTNTVHYTHQLTKLIPVTFRNLSTGSQLKIDSEIAGLKGSQTSFLRTYAVTLLSHTLIKYNTISFEKQEAALAFLENLPISVTEKLVRIYEAFAIKVNDALTPEAIEETFTPEAS